MLLIITLNSHKHFKQMLFLKILSRGWIVWRHTHSTLMLLNTPSVKPVEFKVSTHLAPTQMDMVWPWHVVTCGVNLFQHPPVVFTPSWPVCSLMPLFPGIHLYKEKCLQWDLKTLTVTSGKDCKPNILHQLKSEVLNRFSKLLLKCAADCGLYCLYANKWMALCCYCFFFPGIAPHCLDPGTVQSSTVETCCGDKWEESMQAHKSIRDMSGPAPDTVEEKKITK